MVKKYNNENDINQTLKIRVYYIVITIIVVVFSILLFFWTREMYNNSKYRTDTIEKITSNFPTIISFIATNLSSFFGAKAMQKNKDNIEK